jgi:hypothetical protein
MRKYLALAIVYLFGCATTPPPAEISPELRRAVGSVRLLEGPLPPGFRIAGQVEGIACGEEPETVPEMGMAREKLKFEAAKLKATVVAAIFCQEEHWYPLEGCYRVIRCMGDAGNLP